MEKKIYEFVSQHMDDPIVQWKTCPENGQEFAVFKSDLDFYKQLKLTFAGKEFEIPAPKLSPLERQRRRLSWRNERKLYRRKCDATGKSIISFVSPDKPYPVYERSVRFSDVYDPLKYGRDFDFSKTFAENFKCLLDTVPRYSVQQQDPMQNSDFCNCASSCKNCYFLFDSDFNENSLYSNVLRRSKWCLDCSFVDTCENCYECINCESSYKLSYSQHCINCTEAEYCYNCTNCSFCFASSNLVNKTYCIFNKQYTKEEYKTEIARLKSLYAPDQLLAKVRENLTVPGLRMYQSDRSLGANLVNTKETVLSFDCQQTENIAYCDVVTNADTCRDISSVGEKLSKAYDALSVGLGAQNVYFSSTVVIDSSDIYYSYICFPNVHHCFGCVGMKNNSYCIFNKQYSKAEYEKKVAQIIEHMIKTGERGEFFPITLSPFGYNETLAQEYFPITQEQATQKGYHRQTINYDTAISPDMHVLAGDDIPKDISTVQDGILNEILICEVSKRPFRIQKMELEFYRKNNVPLPRRHPDIRHQERIQRRPGRDFFIRKCDKTQEEILSIYPDKVPFRVVSEKVFQQEIYG